MRKAITIFLFAALLGPLTSYAQDTIPQPAHQAQDRSDSEEGPDYHYRSWEAPAEYVSETHAERVLREEEPIGDYGQPRWTAHRRFPMTRVYVRPAGMIDFEWWLETKLNLSDTNDVRHRSQYEFEFGLGHRLQLDLYLATQQKGHDGAFELYQEKVELRWALADWGEIWGNPTLYWELVH
ncbi:MAG: hypothetical protein KC561_17575, partial [Myxococcales bacterium]|nr:hypothetical protein [Myxococcales bacterium]